MKSLSAAIIATAGTAITTSSHRKSIRQQFHHDTRSLKQAQFVTFIVACFCASFHMLRDLRVAITIFLFIFFITSLGALERWAEQPHCQSTLP